MKSVVVLTTLAAAAAAQQGLSSCVVSLARTQALLKCTLSRNQQGCTGSMTSDAKAREFNCASADAACFCNNENFFRGLRDCGNQGCPQESGAAESAFAFGRDYCRCQSHLTHCDPLHC